MRRSVLGYVVAAAGGVVSVAAWAEPIAQHVEQNGALYPVTKTVECGEEVTRYLVDGRWADAAEFRALIAAMPPRTLGPGVAERIALGAEDGPLDLIVTLREQPGAVIAREEREAIRAEREDVSARIRAVTRRALPERLMAPEAEAAWRGLPLLLEDQNERRALAERLDAIDTASRQRTFARTQAAVRPSQDAVGAAVVALGGEVRERMSAMNVLAVRLPADAVEALAADPRVARIDLDNPGAPELDNHRVSLGLTTGFWANGITGGVHDVAVLDTGVQQSHPAFAGHIFLSNAGTTDTNGHGTGMAGIMGSQNTTYPGMAYGLETIVVAIAGNDAQSMSGMDYIVSTGVPENTNYSFGNGTANTTDYNPLDRFFDAAVATHGFMVSKSTGNGGFGTGAPTITHPAPAYNLMASANVNDQNTIARSDDRIDSTSSRGPTLAGRKKPDIAAPGTNTLSTNTSGGFSNIGGTSSASPHTGGGIVLLYDMGVTEVMAAKAVLINAADAIDDRGTSSTTDDVFVDGSLWNRRYGWGYLDLGEAYTNGLDVFVGEVPDAPETADYRLYRGQMFANEKATLVWERHVAYSGATYPTQVENLSDLDLRAYAENTGAQLDASTSAIDNVEQIDVTSDAVVVLKVEAFGEFDPDIATERFALATEEQFAQVNGPAFGVGVVAPGSVAAGATFNVTLNLQNTGDVAAHAITPSLAGATVVTGPTPALAPSLAAGASTAFTWTVQAPAGPGALALSVSVVSDSYGETFTGAGSASVNVSGCLGDTNGDLIVDFQDLNNVLSNFGVSGAGLIGDINGDGRVDFADLNVVLSNFGQAC